MNRITDDKGSGFRANPAEFEASAAIAQRGSFGAEQNPVAKPGGGGLHRARDGRQREHEHERRDAAGDHKASIPAP